MSDNGEKPKRPVGRPPNPESLSQRLDKAFEQGRKVGITEGKIEGYKEGYEAAEIKHRPGIFETAKREAFKDLSASKEVLELKFDEIEQEFPVLDEEGNKSQERLIRADRDLIHEMVRKYKRLKQNLEKAADQMSPGRRRENREIVDIQEVRLS